uniref:Uncharacterized protein n=1 Tax=Romanomermis culicivorax TaxID=13658 RepID=A0A915IM85_ROMCU
RNRVLLLYIDAKKVIGELFILSYCPLLFVYHCLPMDNFGQYYASLVTTITGAAQAVSAICRSLSAAASMTICAANHDHKAAADGCISRTLIPAPADNVLACPLCPKERHGRETMHQHFYYHLQAQMQQQNRCNMLLLDDFDSVNKWAWFWEIAIFE